MTMDTLNTLNTGTNIHLTALSGNGVLGGRKRSQPGYNKGLRPSVSRIEGAPTGGGGYRAHQLAEGPPAPAHPRARQRRPPHQRGRGVGGGAAQRHAPNTQAGSVRHRHQSVRHHRTNSGTTGSGNGHRQHSVGTTGVRESCDGRAPRRRTVGPAGGGGGDVCATPARKRAATRQETATPVQRRHRRTV